MSESSGMPRAYGGLVEYVVLKGTLGGEPGSVAGSTALDTLKVGQYQADNFVNSGSCGGDTSAHQMAKRLCRKVLAQRQGVLRGMLTAADYCGVARASPPSRRHGTGP
jgi:hypothetical protein